mgnify:CR=1 FL=1|jgi:hypothetical protein|tara:strand:- start:679 stop:894 length:216 start_codon:yes stop_codon:yes gene_type:complete
MANYIEKDIKIAKHYFILKIYPALEGTEDICWEIFPSNYSASLYAFSNKQRIKNIIEKRYIYEPKKTKCKR